ncbi:MAG: hypothetical protein IKC38_04045 [Clostridia bacterium]|nr:hypothetical protein [Clostridia bacterium]
MSQLRAKSTNIHVVRRSNMPSIEELAVIIVAMAVGALMIMLCMGDVVAALGILFLLTAGAVLCAGVFGILFLTYRLFAGRGKIRKRGESIGNR